jgi:protein O-mannosyl-transferase
MGRSLQKKKIANKQRRTTEGSSEHSGRPGAGKFLQKRIVHLLLITVLGLFAYSNTFHVPFQFDDRKILNSPVVKDLDNFISNTKGYEHDPRRFIGYLSLALNYHVGESSVPGYHALNLAIHIANAFILYFLVLLTFRTPAMRQSADAFPRAPALIALFSSLLFVAHPIQTQAVTYIVQRFASLATLFYLLSLVMYARGRLIWEQVRAAVDERFSHRSYLAFALYFFSLISAVCAMKTKEIAFTLPAVVLLYEFFFFKSSAKTKFLYLLPVVLTALIIPFSLLLHGDQPLGKILADLAERTRIQTNISRWDYLVTEIRVVTTYIRLLFAPINQNLDYDYPIYHSLFTTPVFLSFLFLSSICAFLV